MPLSTKCPLCANPLEKEPFRFGNGVVYQCETCTWFVLDDSYEAAAFHHLTEYERGILSIRAINASKQRPENALPIAFGTVQELLHSYQQPSPDARRVAVLDYVKNHSQDMGSDVPFDPDRLYPRFGCATRQALRFLLNGLEQEELLHTPKRGHLRLTSKGWIEVGRFGGGVRGTCFVAMSFDEAMEPARKAITEAIESVGLRPLRVDKEEHNRNINDFILAEIRKAEALVADFTMHRNGVYFEAGFALGLFREVIYCCRDTDFAQSHFDTRSYNHIIWNDEAELSLRLRVRLLNTVPSLRGA